MLLSLDEVRAQYGSSSSSSSSSSSEDLTQHHAVSGAALNISPVKDLRLQMGKLCRGVGTSIYVQESSVLRQDLATRDQLMIQEQNAVVDAAATKEEEEEEVYVTPTSFRTLIGEVSNIYHCFLATAVP